MDRKPPPLAPGSLQPPALLRVQNEVAWLNKGKGKAREPLERELATPSKPVSAPPPSTSTSLAVNHGPPMPSSSRQEPHQIAVSSSNGNPRRLGLLGIPLSDSEDDDEDGLEPSVMSSESLEANPPVSPIVPPAPAPPVPPAPTYSRGGSTRSGPSTRGERQSEGAAFVSEQNFRDIVDDLTLQNQQLRAKLKRLESAKVPNNLKNERLFEVRFFQGLPKTRRREIESFLTDYVQTLSTSDSRHGSTGSDGSRAGRVAVEQLSTSGHGNGDAVSSMGRSFRSSEKDALARATIKADADAAEAAVSLKGSKGSASGSGSRSGTGSGNSREQRRSRADGVPRYAPTIVHEPLGSAPLTTTSAVVDPPSLLRRPADIFPPDRDVLAAPSFSGVEPLSTTGTGHEMRISDPASRKRKRLASSLSNDMTKDKHRRPHSTRTNSTNGSVASYDPDTLENTIVQMIECLFLESLPPDSDDETPASPPHNPLQSEPFPLPARSSSNTQYLRTILASEEYRHVGGWVYLNIVATFAALHRLSASIATIRHALRSKSDLIEVSADGSKIRWKGPSRKPPKKVLEDQTEAVQDSNNHLAEEKEIREKAEEQMEIDGRGGGDRRSRSSTSSSEPATDSIFDGQLRRPSAVRQNSSTFATSTAPTSLNPSNSKNGSNSKMGSEWRAGGSSSNGTRSAGGSGGDRLQLKGSDQKERNTPLDNSSSLRNSVEEVGSPARREQDGPVEVLGSAAEVQQPNRYQYIPLFARRAESPLSTSEDSPENDSDAASDDDSGSNGRLPKRRKGYEGGVVYFANDLFCSDLAGDFEVRAKLKLSADNTSSSSVPLGDSSSRDAMEIETDEADTASRSGIVGSVISDSKRSEEVSIEKKEGEEEEDEDEDIQSEKSMEAVELGNITDKDHPLLEVVESAPLSPELYTRDAYLSAPRPALRLSAMSEATASDHFTMHIKYLHRLSPSESSTRPFPRSSIFTLPALFTFDHSPSLYCKIPRPSLVEHKTLHHHPSVHARPPRVLMSLSSDASDSESDMESLSSVQRHFRQSAPSSIEERQRKRRLKNSILKGHHRFDPSHHGVLGGGSGGGGGDYLMSLALPLNGWAPVTKRSTPSVERLSSSRAGTGSGEPSESLITLD